MANIVVVDYGMANLRSVQKALEKVGHAASITGDPNRVAEADKLVLPGVGPDIAQRALRREGIFRRERVFRILRLRLTFVGSDVNAVR